VGLAWPAAANRAQVIWLGVLELPLMATLMPKFGTMGKAILEVIFPDQSSRDVPIS
jgi:hypothetical protein